MRIVTTTTVFGKEYPCGKAAKRLAAHGFDGLDMGFDYALAAKRSPFKAWYGALYARYLRRAAKKAGTEYTHAHAPWGDAGYLQVPLCLKMSKRIGAKYVVVHPTYTEADGAWLNDEKSFIRRNVELVVPWLALAEKCGVVMLSENLLSGPARDPRIIARLVRAVDSPFFGWCYDTGHAHLFGFRPEQLAECAVAPLSLHLQDNRGKGDDHLIPGDGEIDFDATVKALKAIGYAGECVLEAHTQCLNAPDAERDAILDRLFAAGEALRDKFES